MRIIEACNFLGLNEEYTLEDLKKSFGILSKKYHPDLNPSIGQEKMQQLNEAYELLKNNVSQINNSEYEDIKKYKKEKIDIIIRKIYFQNYKELVKSKNIMININELQKQFDIETNFDLNFDFDNAKTKEEILELFNKLYSRIIEYIIDKIIKPFFKEYNIDDGAEELDALEFKRILESPENTLSDIYSKLLEYKDQFNREEVLKNKLNKSIKKYEKEKGYIRLNSIIENIFSITYNNIIKSNYQNIDIEIKKLDEQIQKMFEKFESIEAQFNILKNKIFLTSNEELKKLYNYTYDNWIKNTNFENTTKELEYLTVELYKYTEEKVLFDKYKEIYNLINSRYLSSNTNLITSSNYENISRLNELYLKVIYYFKKGVTERKDKDYFEMFKNIEFTNIENDKKVLENIKLKVNKIYIINKMQNNECNYDDLESFFYINNDNTEQVQIYQIHNDEITESAISKEEFLKKYISLDDLLLSGKIIGKYLKCKSWYELFDKSKNNISQEEQILLIAQNDDFMLYCRKDNKYYISLNNNNDLYEEENSKIEITIESILNSINIELQKRILEFKEEKKLKK